MWGLAILGLLLPEEGVEIAGSPFCSLYLASILCMYKNAQDSELTQELCSAQGLETHLAPEGGGVEFSHSQQLQVAQADVVGQK